MTRTRALGTSISFQVAGVPRGEPRHRYDSRNRRYHVDDSGPARAWKQEVRRAALEALAIPFAPVSAVVPAQTPVTLDLEFLMERPLKHFRGRNRDAGVLRDDAPVLHTAKPDADNLAKAVMDALGPWPTGALPILWEDDQVIAELRVRKRYTALEPGVRVRLTVEEPLEVTARAFLRDHSHEAHLHGEGGSARAHSTQRPASNRSAAAPPCPPRLQPQEGTPR